MGRLKVKSRTDIITNSSSETFVVRSYGKSIDVILKDLLKKNNPRASSGVAGDIEVYDNERMVFWTGEGRKIDGNNTSEYDWLPDGFILVDVDWAKTRLIDYLFEKYWVIDAVDCWGYRRDPKTGRMTQLSDKEIKEWPEDKPKPSFGDVYYHMEFNQLYEACREKLKDKAKYLEEIKKYNLREGYTPESYLEEIEKSTERWFKKHPISPEEKYKYDKDQEQN